MFKRLIYSGVIGDAMYWMAYGPLRQTLFWRVFWKVFGDWLGYDAYTWAMTELINRGEY